MLKIFLISLHLLGVSCPCNWILSIPAFIAIFILSFEGFTKTPTNFILFLNKEMILFDFSIFMYLEEPFTKINPAQ